MSLTYSLRRLAVGVAATALLAGGTVGLVAAATTAGASDVISTPQGVNTIDLHNNTAAVGTDCPQDGMAYWHFVFAPNNGSASFTSITLNLGTETLTFSGAAIVQNGSQTDNVFVAVPAGHSLTDLVMAGSHATYSGAAPGLFNLSHTCEGTVPTTETRTTETPTTETPTTETPTTETPTTETPTTETPTTETPTTETPTTETPTTETPTTETPTSETPTSETPTSESGPAAVEDVTTVAPAPEVLGAVQVNGELPYTGTDTTGMVVAGLSVLVGGAALAGLARTKGRNLGGR